MKNIEFGKKILAILFLFLLFFVFMTNESYTTLRNIYNYFVQDTFLDTTATTEEKDEEVERILLSDIDTAYADNFIKKNELVNLNGTIAKFLDIRGLYHDMGMYVYDNGYIVSITKETSTDYEYEQMVDFKRFLDERGINLLYVNQPTKYVNDEIFREEFGVESYCNRNADKFLDRISKAGINVIDLRDELKEDNMNIYDMFYRTDHHWTIETGLWASKKIAEGLNEYCNYDVDISIYDSSNFSFKKVEECWIGEQGRKVGLSYVGLDDFTIVKPKFDTNYTFISKKGNYDKSFDGFVNDEVYTTERANGSNYGKSWYYSYSPKNIVNHDIEHGKVLLIGDSYAIAMEPFLSLGVKEIKYVVLRDYRGSIRELIEAGDYDTVIIAYAEFMIGAHDNPKSANYKMFTLDKVSK